MKRPRALQTQAQNNKAVSKVTREMVQICILRTLNSRVMLMDSWFSYEWTFGCIAGEGLHFINVREDKQLLPLID